MVEISCSSSWLEAIDSWASCWRATRSTASRPAFRRLGWRIVVVSFAANAGTFIGATLIAQFFMHVPAV